MFASTKHTDMTRTQKRTLRLIFASLAVFEAVSIAVVSIAQNEIVSGVVLGGFCLIAALVAAIPQV